ncbi:MAG: HAD family hydrolase [Blautia sp.]|jgi:putative hydrolase of the HAD superfamily
MKKIKQILAIAGVVLLLLLYASTLVTALMKSPNSLNLFKLSVGCTILVPVLLYAFLMVAKHLEARNHKVEPETTIKNIIFDVGGVLLSFDWEEYLDSFHFPPQIRKAMGDAAFPSPEWNERDRGTKTDEEYFQTFLKHVPQYEKELHQVMENENQSLHIYDYSKTWVKYLQSKGYHTYLLSNISSHMLEGFYQILDFIPSMDGTIFSCEVHQVKPEPEIYQTLINTYGLDPRECLFMDDRAENVEAAKRAGMEAFVFTDFQSAAQKLESYGIK